MNPLSRRIHRGVLGPYPGSPSQSTNQVRDHGTRARSARSPRGRGLKLVRPLDRARARSRVWVPRGIFPRSLAQTSSQIGSRKVAAISPCMCPMHPDHFSVQSDRNSGARSMIRTCAEWSTDLLTGVGRCYSGVLEPRKKNSSIPAFCRIFYFKIPSYHIQLKKI